MCTIFTSLGVFLPYGYHGSSVYTHTQYVHHLHSLLVLKPNGHNEAYGKLITVPFGVLAPGVQ